MPIASLLRACLASRRLQPSEFSANLSRWLHFHATRSTTPPAQGSFLDQFGAEMLGYDAWIGTALPFPGGVVEQVPDWRELTQDPRKYGFHATLKAPMSLNGRRESELHAACADFARQPRLIPQITPVVNSISGFIAVIPETRSAELEQFAADCVRAFDPFRAPLTPDDRARRNPSRLTPRQVEYLDRWGPLCQKREKPHPSLSFLRPQVPPVWRHGGVKGGSYQLVPT